MPHIRMRRRPTLQPVTRFIRCSRMSAISPGRTLSSSALRHQPRCTCRHSLPPFGRQLLAGLSTRCLACNIILPAAAHSRSADSHRWAAPCYSSTRHLGGMIHYLDAAPWSRAVSTAAPHECDCLFFYSLAGRSQLMIFAYRHRLCCWSRLLAAHGCSRACCSQPLSVRRRSRAASMHLAPSSLRLHLNRSSQL